MMMLMMMMRISHIYDPIVKQITWSRR